MHQSVRGNGLKTVVCAVVSLLFVPLLRGEEVQLQVSSISIPSEGHEIRATVFEPAVNGRRPAILVLHGAGGMMFDGAEMRRMSRHLAGEGNTVYLLHYFNRTGTPFAVRGATMERHFGTWRRTVLDAIEHIHATQPGRAPVGIFGYSLGGFLALFAASDNPRVGAVVEHAGGVWKDKLDRLGKLPPVLMIHGERDDRVPFDRYAAPAVPELRKRSPRVETRFFPTEGHRFTPAAMKTVREDTAAFFARSLRRR